jgi:wyosine [tRNA(Phe)-imidazoG37] synthetase (radical SAM superfamily)
MDRFFSWHVDLDALTTEAHAFVTDPHASRNERTVIHALNDMRPEVVDVLEAMVLDGTEDRADVAAYLEAVFAPRMPVQPPPG